MKCPKCGSENINIPPVADIIANQKKTALCQNCGFNDAVTKFQDLPIKTDKEKPIYQRTKTIIGFLIFFFLVGLFLMWKYADWHKSIKWGITVLMLILLIIAMAIEEPTDTSTVNTTKVTPEISALQM